MKHVALVLQLVSPLAAAGAAFLGATWSRRHQGLTRQITVSQAVVDARVRTYPALFQITGQCSKRVLSRADPDVMNPQLIKALTDWYDLNGFLVSRETRTSLYQLRRTLQSGKSIEVIADARNDVRSAMVRDVRLLDQDKLRAERVKQ